MTHWTSYDCRMTGVRACKITGEDGRKVRVEFTPGGAPLWLSKTQVFETREAAIADAMSRKNKHALQQLTYWRNVLNRQIGVRDETQA